MMGHATPYMCGTTLLELHTYCKDRREELGLARMCIDCKYSEFCASMKGHLHPDNICLFHLTNRELVELNVLQDAGATFMYLKYNGYTGMDVVGCNKELEDEEMAKTSKQPYEVFIIPTTECSYLGLELYKCYNIKELLSMNRECAI